jgi:hypothetical protein
MAHEVAWTESAIASLLDAVRSRAWRTGGGKYNQSMQRSIIWGAIVLILSVFGCGQATQPKPSTPSGEILRVHVTAAGVITANGRDVSLEDLKKEFASLAAAGGSLLYTRDNPTADPHPNAMKVIQAAADANLPILMPDK